jgi:2-polyprenyl-3-methyl-5-hydroxy-6-metoxy-1,4-benzoquinol methylase
VIYPSNYYSFKETDRPNPIVKAVRGWMARKKGSFYMAMVPAGDANVVDIGCGDGRLLDELNSSCPDGWRYHGIDWSDLAVQRIREKGYEGRSGDFSRMDLADWYGKFDLAVMHQLIEHVRDPREALEKVLS